MPQAVPGDRVAVDSIFHVHPRGGPAVSVIRPAGSTGPEPMPAILFLHGGGWTAGGRFDIYEPLCRQLANAIGAIVLYVHYCLAPEHPFPAAFDDTRAALALGRMRTAAGSG